MRLRFEILEIDVLHSHEETKSDMLDCLVDQIAKDGALFKAVQNIDSGGKPRDPPTQKIKY